MLSPRLNPFIIFIALVAAILVFQARKSPIGNGTPSVFGIRIGSKLQYVWHNVFNPPHPSSPSSKNTLNVESDFFRMAHLIAWLVTVKPASAYGEYKVSAKRYSRFAFFH